MTQTEKGPVVRPPTDKERAEYEKKAAEQLTIVRAKMVLNDRNAASIFFASLAMRLRMEPAWWVPTAGVDGKTIFYNPHWFSQLKRSEIFGVVIHEVMHCSNKHQSRRDNRDHDRFNIACDLAINHLIEEAGFKLPQSGCFAGKPGPFQDLPTGQSSEWYYSRITQEMQDACDDGGGGSATLCDPKAGQSMSDPGGCGAVMDAGDKAEQAESEAEWQVAVAQAATIAKQRGDLPAGIKRFVGDVVTPKLPWAELLRRFVQTIARNDFSWFPPNRRYVSQGLYIPGLRSEELGTIYVTFDTSGSISRAEMSQFAAEIQDILSTFTCRVIILFHDSKVAHVQEWSSEDGPIELQPAGGGGTSHIPVFQHIEENDERVACVICLTDGETRYPSDPPPIPTLWAMTTNQVAPFGETVQMN